MEEVAAILSASTAAVKVRVHDARRHIERRLKQNPAMVAVAEPRGRRGVTELRCADVEARFVDAFDGRLDPAESVRFHSHIEGCAACRERAALWRALVPRLRDAVPPGPDAMATRRMQIEIERRLAGADRRVAAAALAGLVGAGDRAGRGRRGRRDLAARRAGRARPLVGYAAVVSVRGEARVGDQASRAAARVPVGAPIALAAGAAVELALDSGAALSVDGPSRLALEGNARAVAVRLTAGKLNAAVAHRQPDETFAVITTDLRVEVRGTKFSVAAGDATARASTSAKGRSRFSSRMGRRCWCRRAAASTRAPCAAPPPELPAAVASDRRRAAVVRRPRPLVPDDGARGPRQHARRRRRSARSGRSRTRGASCAPPTRSARAARPTARTSSAT